MPRNVADTLRQAAGRGAERSALSWQDRSVSWGELDGAVDALARGLRALDLPDSAGYPARVVLALPNVPQFAEAYFAVLRAGLVAVPVNPGYTGRELIQVLTDSGAVVLIGTPEVFRAVGAALPQYRFAVGTADGVPDLAELARPGEPVATTAGGEDLAVLLYTSGTEGSPKGAMLSHRALLANHTQVARIEPPVLGPDDVVLLVLPLFHAFGLNSGLGAVAYHGAHGILVERFDPAETLRLIAAHRVTIVVGVPPMFVAWSLLPDLAGAFGSVRAAISGAAPLDPAAARRFQEATGDVLAEGYGLTETAPVLTSTLVSPAHKRGSVGQPIPGVALKLVGAGGEEILLAEDDFDDLAPGSPGTDPGEIVVSGDNLFSGYWPDRRDGPDEDGWWATGDVAYADADGDLFLVDRLRELILVSGFNVYPYEVEQVLRAHPAVSEAAVLGDPHPYTGQTVKAYVVTRSAVTVEELISHCERNLARFKCPTAIEFRPALPHSATGKVRKAALRD
ncbi:MAG TPA: AMP-binding protein [Rugosimonospora sp.]|nr:AMP-binding protein [Rugosimonospora sp.]